MEEHRLLDVPITEAEHRRRNSDQEQLLSSSDVTNYAHGNEPDPSVRRFGSLRTTIYQVNNPDHIVRSSAVHERIPPDAHEHEPSQKAFDFSQPTNYSREAAYAPLNYPFDLWQPFWLRKLVLATFLALFLALVVTLVLLWHFSNTFNGFHLSSSVTYYAWTYAPVAFMIVVVSLWRQVDYYLKLLAPWDELRKGPVSASHSLLVDYVSPLNVVSFLSAFKRGYIPVVMSIIVFFSLKVTVSTYVSATDTMLITHRLFSRRHYSYHFLP